MRLHLLESSDNDWMQHPAFRRLLHLGVFDDDRIAEFITRAKSSKDPYISLAKDLQQIVNHNTAHIKSGGNLPATDLKALEELKDIIDELTSSKNTQQRTQSMPQSVSQSQSLDWTEHAIIKQLEQFFKNPKDYYRLLENANEADNPYAVVYTACKKKRDNIDPADALIHKDEIEKLDLALEQLKALAEQGYDHDQEEPTKTDVKKPKDEPSFASEFMQGLKGNKDRPTSKNKGLISRAIKNLGKSAKNKFKRAKRSWKAGRRGDIGSILSNAFTGNDRYDSDKLERLYRRRNRT